MLLLDQAELAPNQNLLQMKIKKFQKWNKKNKAPKIHTTQSNMVACTILIINSKSNASCEKLMVLVIKS